jgi:hypothetical protein
MSEQNSQLAVRPRASQQLATLLGMEPGAMLDTIKAQCFKGNPANISNEQLGAFVSIAAEMGVNPLLPGMLYAFPIQGGGIVPMMGPDGVYKKLSEHPDVDGWETTVYPEDVTQSATHATTKIWRKGRERPLQYTALLSEWKVANNPNWNTRTRHMLSLRSLKQCARQVIHGVPYDEDERVIMGEINVTPQTDQPAPERPAPPPRAKKGAAAVPETPRPAAAPIIEAEIVQPAPAAAPAPKTEPDPTPEPTPTPAPVAEKKQPRVFLKAEELIDAEITVSASTGMKANMPDGVKNAAKVSVTGDFVGDVYDFNGGTDTTVAGGPATVAPKPIWTAGKQLRVQLFGRHNKANGKVIAEVKSVAEVLPESQAMDVE